MDNFAEKLIAEDKMKNLILDQVADLADKEVVVKQIDKDIISDMIYTNMFLADKIENYIIQLVGDIKKTPCYRQKIKFCCNNIVKGWDDYKRENYLSYSEETQYTMADVLDYLDEHLSRHVTILYSQIYKYNAETLTNKCKNYADLLTAFTRAFMIKLLADFYLYKIKMLNSKTEVNGVKMPLLRDDMIVKSLAKNCSDLIMVIGPMLGKNDDATLSGEENIQLAFNVLRDKLTAVKDLVKNVQTSRS